MAKKGKGDLPPEIVDIADYAESINILCHGDPGSGKTYMWSKLPNLLIIAVEDGTVAAARAGSTAKVWRVKNWTDWVDVYVWLRDNPGVFKYVLIDSITKLQALCLKRIMELVVEANSTRDPHIPAQGDHFKWQLMMKEAVSDFNDLDVNCIWLARSMNKEDPEGEDIVVPLIEGKDYQISAWVAGEMGLLCYLKKKKNKNNDKMERVLYTNEHPLYWSKDRFDCLPHAIKNPDAKKILALIESSGKKSA